MSPLSKALVDYLSGVMKFDGKVAVSGRGN